MQECIMSVYLAELFELKRKEPEIWQCFNEGNSSVNKSSFPLVAIGAEHGMERRRTIQ